MDEVRKLIAEEGKSARNLLAWSVPMDGSLDTSPGRMKKPPMSPRSGKSILPRTSLLDYTCRPGRKRPCSSGGSSGRSSPHSDNLKPSRHSNLVGKSRVRSASAGRDPKQDFKARYWAFLFENLRRAVDEIYETCVTDESILECKEAILVLENYTRDFHSLIEYLRLKTDFENSPPFNSDKSTAPKSEHPPESSAISIASSASTPPASPTVAFSPHSTRLSSVSSIAAVTEEPTIDIEEQKIDKPVEGISDDVIDGTETSVSPEIPLSIECSTAETMTEFCDVLPNELSPQIQYAEAGTNTDESIWPHQEGELMDMVAIEEAAVCSPEVAEEVDEEKKCLPEEKTEKEGEGLKELNVVEETNAEEVAVQTEDVKREDKIPEQELVPELNVSEATLENVVNSELPPPPVEAVRSSSITIATSKPSKNEPLHVDTSLCQSDTIKSGSSSSLSSVSSGSHSWADRVKDGIVKSISLTRHHSSSEKFTKNPQCLKRTWGRGEAFRRVVPSQRVRGPCHLRILGLKCKVSHQRRNQLPIENSFLMMETTTQKAGKRCRDLNRGVVLLPPINLHNPENNKIPRKKSAGIPPQHSLPTLTSQQIERALCFLTMLAHLRMNKGIMRKFGRR